MLGLMNYLLKLSGIDLTLHLLQKNHTLPPKVRLTARQTLCLTALNRGWLKAVAWEYVPKIPGA
jgi:hypothetical protein